MSVLVVGAGLARVPAAIEIQERGHDPRVIEAQDRRRTRRMEMGFGPLIALRKRS